MDFDALCLRIKEEVKTFAMVPAEGLRESIRLALDAIDSDRAGDIVECGTWLGGSSFAMLLAQRYQYGRIVKPVWMFDSFEGLPPAGDLDGELAHNYQRDTDSPAYRNNCEAPIDQVRAAIGNFGFGPDEAIVVEGWFDRSIPAVLDRLAGRKIALLRVDCDWYDSVLFVLKTLHDHVTDGGAVILDDYYCWDGCTLAVHEFLAANKFPWQIRSIESNLGAWFVKGQGRVER